MGATVRPEPDVTYLVPLHAWRLDVTITCTDPPRGQTFTIPAGFACDLASVPRVLWGLLAPFELSCAAPLCHDWLYRHGGAVPGATYARADADALFRDLMAAEGVGRLRRQAAYLAVRAFGARAWQSPALPS